MSAYKQLNKAADILEKMASAIEEQDKQLKTAADQLAQAKTAAARPAPQPAPAVDRVRLGQLAKTASTAIKAAGLLSSAEQADAFAASVLDHSKALEQLAKLASLVQPVKLGGVDEASSSESAVEGSEDVWQRSMAAVLARTSNT